MIILDENVILSQVLILEGWRIRVRQIGHDIGHRGMKDKEIITLLHSLNKTTFFTGDSDFFDHALCHANYCLVNLNVSKNEAAVFIRRILRHTAFDTEAKRMGKVICGTIEGVYVWQLHAKEKERLVWHET